jgi:hypothetical protein
VTSHAVTAMPPYPPSFAAAALRDGEGAENKGLTGGWVSVMDFDSDGVAINTDRSIK